ncbi:MAG TPA: hypothetical protein VKX46_10820 [Ktedonobacteraceae bacterium]|nr:hypothetical protein [Ktedonobacteraceae bacterium]
MRKLSDKSTQTDNASRSLVLKCGAILLLLALSIMVVACGPDTTTASSNLNGPVVTVTIRIGNTHATPTPGVAPYNCGAWVTNTTPTINAGAIVVNAKYEHLNNGNPEGVESAYAQATVFWGDGGSQTLAPVYTTHDGLAVFTFPIPPDRPGIVNHMNLVTVSFTKDGTPGCTVDQNRAAYFVLVGASPVSTPGNGGTAPTGQPTPPGRRGR